MLTDDSITIVDLFSGCGGLTAGFHSYRAPGRDGAPFRTVGAVEHDLAAASTYAVNFGEHTGVERIHAGDIEAWDPSVVQERVDVILGGPPCQGFSALNKRNLVADLGDARNVLWREYVRVVRALRPKVFVIENVGRFLDSDEYALLRAETEGPDGLLGEYELTEARVLNAADYGVPQARRRAIVLATRRDVRAAHPRGLTLDYPAPTHTRVPRGGPVPVPGGPGTEDLPVLSPWETVASVFAKAPRATSTNQLPARSCAPLGVDLPGAYRTFELHLGRTPRPMSRLRYEAIPPGGNRNDLPPELSTQAWLRHRSGTGDVMGRLHLDRPSVTIRTEFFKPEKGRYLHPSEHRPITHMEAAHIQGFPEDFRWCGTKLQIARQIGNAVPVGLAAALAGQVYRYLAEVGATAAAPSDAAV
ncbi:DNA cytosine methyltransferase [Nocardiopsis sp. MG754419]|uniref:DNA cytosine methyltransferase n=1 Tax=Nocardiopsis sp. MG754419 TaxID=2259865 RepID=UPI001BAB4E73|nr:DNA cytosine methyltransferase [Nocardiopsis sp. MG754419]MBR8744260.1 DNA cytosine methyltransferase [Nocardiopsis sp. MG754419]